MAKKPDSATEQNRLIADPQKELEKIAALLNVEPHQTADAVSALLECNAAFEVQCNKLISSNPRHKHDGRGNWRMLVHKDAWEAFEAGVTPLLSNAADS